MVGGLLFSPRLSRFSRRVFSRDCDIDEVPSCVLTVSTPADFLRVAALAGGEARP